MEPRRRRSIALLQLFRRIAELAGVPGLRDHPPAGLGRLPGGGRPRGGLYAGEGRGVGLPSPDFFSGLPSPRVCPPFTAVSPPFPGKTGPARAPLEP